VQCPQFYKRLGTEAPWVEKQQTKTGKTVVTLTKALRKTTSCNCRAKKAQKHGKNCFFCVPLCPTFRWHWLYSVLKSVSTRTAFMWRKRFMHIFADMLQPWGTNSSAASVIYPPPQNFKISGTPHSCGCRRSDVHFSTVSIECGFVDNMDAAPAAASPASWGEWQWQRKVVKRCNNTVSCEYLWIRRTRDYERLLLRAVY